MRKLNAKFDAVIVKPLETEETMYGSIVVPDAGKDRNEQGEVISVGPGKHTVTGEFIPTETKVGDIVVLPTMGFTKLQFNGDEFYVGSEQQILATITTDENA
jgi:chaperonin GroES